jgi:hypothetical protein
MDLWASDSNGAALIETRIGPINLRTSSTRFRVWFFGFNEIATANDGDSYFARVAQASKAKIREARGFEGIYAADFCDPRVTRERDEFRNTFA